MDAKLTTPFRRHFSVRLVKSSGQTPKNKKLDMESRPGKAIQDSTDDELFPSSPSPLTRGTVAYSTSRSLHRVTREALPRLDNYRNLTSIVKSSSAARQRPSIDELLYPTDDKEVAIRVENENIHEQKGNKFGWIKGVLVRCLLNIWGVILFIRLSWMTGQAGILQSIVIATISLIVTIITTLSMSAIGTNGQVKGGGSYFMISRTMGPEVGGAIGVVFSFAHAIAASLNIVGFCESMNDLLGSFSLKIMDGGSNDIRIVSCITLVALVVICLVGMEWEARCQLLLLLVLLAAMLDFVIGAFVGPLSDEEIAKGFVGMNGTLFLENLYSDYRIDPVTGEHQNFFSVFGVFFPACIGILAGASISGDLKDPSTAIPKGTLLGIIITYLSYIFFILICGAGTLRDASGNVTELLDWNFVNCTDMPCKYGLVNSVQVMELMSLYGPIIYAGCFAASLSTALASLVSAPKTIQALAKDNLYPYISFLGKGYGKNEEPLRAYVLFSIIIVIFNVIARLDTIAPIITNFFLATFAAINIATFHADIQSIPGWRPTFKYYNAWLSLAGGLICTVIMFLIEWWTAVGTITIIILLYIAVWYRKPDVNWGSTTQAQSYSIALKAVFSLSSVEEHIKNYRPQILVLSGDPSSRPPLIHFANAITKNQSLLVVAHCTSEVLTKNTRMIITQDCTHWLSKHKIQAFFALSDGLPLDKGARLLMNTVGLGKLVPNMMLLGYKADWQSCSSKELISYFRTIHNGLDNRLAVGILRLEGGLDYSFVGENLTKQDESNNESTSDSDLNSSRQSITTTSPEYTQDSSIKKADKEDKTKLKKEKAQEYRSHSGDVLSNTVIDAMIRFTRKQPTGTIDVWWLFDDGGLTLLLPYVLTKRAIWSKCSIRVFFLADKKDDLGAEQRRMAELMGKFRINFSDVVIITDVQQKPNEESLNKFNNLISKFRGLPEDDKEALSINESELKALREKTNRHIRLHELLLEHSREATLVVMTLPMPVLGTVSAPLYMAWLETLTMDMPPFLLLRGNQSSVLTFYS
ncbi:hypothetical protein SK128_015899 [Halocaridina rubra]|uniref:Uncharacterized protein n=1 Tax=Halocaridina rubra TaxID=373956 RepID=A0AAN8WRK9_HALRR